MSTRRDPNWVPYDGNMAQHQRPMVEQVMFEPIPRAAAIFVGECENPMKALAEFCDQKCLALDFRHYVTILKVNR